MTFAPVLIVRRYQALGLILFGILLGSVALFSRDSDFFPTRPPYPNRIALTFDDGPHPEFTGRILRVLEEHQVAATFFVVGKQAARYPDLLKAMDRRGHELANHTYNHPNLALLHPTDVVRELDETRGVIESVTQRRQRFFRPPGGQYKASTLDTANRSGYQMILWTVFPQDHVPAITPETIYERVMATARDGGVVLFHSGVEATLAVLPRVISDLRAKGFQFLTVSEMLEEKINPVVRSAWYFPGNGDALAAGPANKPSVKKTVNL
ncbi:MAG: polysaccharide deacetylase family protein [Elusimicrobia bacterium]|nr:polysaccharide deacetylase family protein [Elusimicrobiota bacterium]